MSENVIKPESKKAFFIIMVTAGIVLAVFMLYRYRVDQAMHAKQAYIEQMRSDFVTYIPEKIPEYITDLPYPGKVTVEAGSSFEDTVFKGAAGSTRWHRWKDTMTVTLRVDKAFDKLSDREIYLMLAEFSGCAWNAYYKVRNEYFPDYNKEEYSDILKIDYFNLPVNRMGIDEHFCIASPHNTYEHATMLDDYYVQNGRDHFIRDEKSRWKTPIPTPDPWPAYRPTTQPKKKESAPTDPYEAHLFDDPDDYADYYAEEFAEEIGEDADAGYEEAFDHWIYWHETND